MIYQDNYILGKTSAIGFGCWNFGAQWNRVNEEDSIKIIRYAIDNGVNVVDVSESYGFPDGQCEILLGKALQDGYRDKVKIISKIGWFGRRSQDHFQPTNKIIPKACNILFNKVFKYKDFDVLKRSPELLRLCGHACCGRLNTSYIDILLCHDNNPSDMENFIHAFELLISEGFIKHYGISTENINVLKRFYDLSNGNCEAVECDYSLLNRMVESDFLPFCNKKIAVFTRCTLSRGLLSGKYDRDTVFTESSRIDWNKGGAFRKRYEQCLDAVDQIKCSLPKSIDIVEASYKYVFSNPLHPTVIVGVTSINQIIKNINIASSYLQEDLYPILRDLKTDLRCGW